MTEPGGARRIVLFAHYFPPINSSGGKRMEAMAKYFTRAGRSVTVITTRKSAVDGNFTERFPDGVTVYQLDWLGRPGESKSSLTHETYAASRSGRMLRKTKDVIMHALGQLPDPRLPFAFGVLNPFLHPDVKRALQSADIVVGTTPPWADLLAALFAHLRFRKPMVLDYRDQFSMCYAMPGGKFAKTLELWVDRALARRAAGLVAVSEPMARYYAPFNPRVAVILNGYDPEIMGEARNNAKWRPRPAGDPLVIRYLGVVAGDRIPINLLDAMLTLQAEGQLDESAIRFEFYGEASQLQKILASDYPSLAGMFAFHAHVPYRESLRLAITADHLLFCETSRKESLSAQGILTTKLFEYLASGRPVLADISEDTLAGGLIKKAGRHHFVSNERESFKAFLRSPKFWNPPASIDEPFVKSLSRAEQAEQYLSELDAIHEKAFVGR